MLRKLTCAALLSVSCAATSATIEIKDPTAVVDAYALMGAAYVCGGSRSLSTTQRLEFKEILEHYKKVVRKMAGSVDFSIARGAAEEKFNITSRNANYASCSKAVKK